MIKNESDTTESQKRQTLRVQLDRHSPSDHAGHMTTDQPPVRLNGRIVHRIEDVARLAGISVDAAYKLVARANLEPVDRIGNVYADADVKRALKRPRAGMGGPRKKETIMLTITEPATGQTATVTHDQIADTIRPWYPDAPAEIAEAIDGLQAAWTPGSSTAHEQDALATYLDLRVETA